MYHIFDISLDSDIQLPELPEGTARATVIKIMSGMDSERVRCEPEYFCEWEDARGEIIMIPPNLEGNYVFVFAGLLSSFISASGDTVIYSPWYKVPEETVRHLIIHQLIPRILGQQGQLILHASAVQLPDGHAILFLGDTGWGKSTLASSYYENGAKILTDDCLMIKIIDNRLYCVPNYPGLRLYTDSVEAVFKKETQRQPVAHYTSKERLILDSEPAMGGPIPVSAIFLLSDPGIEDVDKVSINKIQGAKEIMAILKNSFLLDREDKTAISRQFRNASEVANEVSPVIYELSYPRQYEMLEEVRSAVKAITNPRR